MKITNNYNNYNNNRVGFNAKFVNEIPNLPTEAVDSFANMAKNHLTDAVTYVLKPFESELDSFVSGKLVLIPEDGKIRKKLTGSSIILGYKKDGVVSVVPSSDRVLNQEMIALKSNYKSKLHELV